MSNKKYWQSFAELNDNGSFQKLQKDEFKEDLDLPFEDSEGKGLMDAKTPRRDFLKYLGFSTAAATIAASCEMPVRKAIPHAVKPENVVPGIAKYYATTFVQEGEVVPTLAKVRDGRPIKLEGNNLATLTLGGTSPRMQASVLDLYDTYRITHPKHKNGNKWAEVPTFQQLDTMIGNAMAGLGGAPVVLLTNTIFSPSTRQVITEFLGRYPGSRHVQYDAVSFSGMLQANETSFGRRALPSYQFDRAKVIVSIGADFLGTWLSPVEFGRQYSYGRKIDEKNPVMSKHYQLESYLSMTGANADERFVYKPSEVGNVVMALYAALGGTGAPAVNFGDAKLKAGITRIAADLRANNGAALVVCGSNDPNVQTIVNAINSAIGAYGTAINWSTPLLTKQGVDREMVELVNAMNAGQVGAVLICGANPAYDYHNAKGFIDGLRKVKLSVSFNEKMDETTQECQYAIPSHHYLESWGDAEPKPGFVYFIQPTINPLFKTRPFQTSLLKWSGNNTEYDAWFRQFWTSRLGGQQAFETALQDGLLETGAGGVQRAATPLFGTTAATDTSAAPAVTTTNTGTAPAGPFNGTGVAAAVTALTGARRGGQTEVILYQNVAMASGKQSGNPWLLELPDPVTKATWDNYAMISTAKATELGIDYKDKDYEYYMDKPVIELTAPNGAKVSLPVMVIPGMHPDTIAIAVGYGRHEAYGKASHEVGKNVFGFARFNGTTTDYFNSVTVTGKPTGTQKIAQTQIHNSYENRFEVVRETTMGTFRKYPNEIKEWREELHKDYAPKSGDFRKEATLYGDHVQPGLKWGMSIDMNSCIGCQACVVACHVENNVPVVGKSEVLRYHDMHWLRIDRYFVTNEENPDDLKAVVFQPMLCQHCDNAPCENVCPVAATPHSSEGINMMTYNRCIGTRYCANNCPYKVRRFNWADYTGSTSFGKGGAPNGVGKLDPVVEHMNDDLTRMVLNPDVTVRSRGVMEKCTFCVQRVQEGKLKAKLQNRELIDGDVKTACQQACPTSAIVFGNVNDTRSQITQMRAQNTQRNYYVIEQIHTLPNVNYLAKIRNTDEIVAKEHEAAEHAAQGKDLSKPGDKPAPEESGAH